MKLEHVAERESRGCRRQRGRNVRFVLEPPSGTVTFLFTDVEGSTRLWQEHPDAMTTALARHAQGYSLAAIANRHDLDPQTVATASSRRNRDPTAARVGLSSYRRAADSSRQRSLRLRRPPINCLTGSRRRKAPHRVIVANAPVPAI